MPLSRFLTSSFGATLHSGRAPRPPASTSRGKASVKASKIRTLAAAAALALVASLGALAPAAAHHSFAPYEPDRQITFKGKVTHFQWTNPHVYIEMEAADENGDMRQWLIECANTSILGR